MNRYIETMFHAINNPANNALEVKMVVTRRISY